MVTVSDCIYLPRWNVPRALSAREVSQLGDGVIIFSERGPVYPEAEKARSPCRAFLNSAEGGRRVE